MKAIYVMASKSREIKVNACALRTTRTRVVTKYLTILLIIPTEKRLNWLI